MSSSGARLTGAIASAAVAGCAHLGAAMDDPACLAAAETAFAAHSVREDMRCAFIAHFAADGVFVRRGWVNAIGALTPQAAPPIVLDWKPVYTQTAASGEMGLSTGPWKLASKAKPDAPPAYGQFVSVWKRAARGAPWQVAVDLGISHPDASLWNAPLETRVATQGGAPAADSVEGAERDFARAAGQDGTRAAYARYGSPRLRFYREGFAPLAGRDAALASAAMRDERLGWTVEASETARSRDLGYARGRFAAPAAPEKTLGYFLRVWQREAGAWAIALDVVNAAPPAP